MQYLYWPHSFTKVSVQFPSLYIFSVSLSLCRLVTAYCCFFIVNVECQVFVNGWKIQQLKCMMSLKQHLVNGYWKLKKLMGMFFVRVILQSLGVLFPVEFLMNLNVLHKIMIFLWRLGRPYESVLDREKTSVVYYVWNWIVT